MKKLVARVQLHKLKSEKQIPDQVFGILQDAMAEMKFYPIIKEASTKKWYKMLPDQYVSYASVSVADALAKIKLAADKTNRTYSVFVTDSSTALWDNLDEIVV